MKGNKVENLIWIIFFGIGLIFVIIGMIICVNVFNYKNKVETTGIITEIGSYRDLGGQRENSVYVEYTVDGRVYESALNGYSSNFYEGKEISDDIKEDIFFIYKMFGDKSFFKLREIIFSEYSPVEEIFSNTYLLYLHILYNIGVSKSKTKDWFKENFLELN